MAYRTGKYHSILVSRHAERDGEDCEGFRPHGSQHEEQATADRDQQVPHALWLVPSALDGEHVPS